MKHKSTDLEAMETIQRICDDVGCEVSFVSKNNVKAVKKAFKGICKDITEKEAREKAIKEVEEYYTSYEKFPIKTDDDLHSQLCRLVDYCVDNTENGYAFEEWLTEREKMWIIYQILDKCKHYIYNKNCNKCKPKENK